MIAANFTEFRTGLKKYLDKVEHNQETLIIKRKSGKGTVMIFEWLDLHKNELLENWNLCQDKKVPKKIEPLK